jgi:hypothetical protein
LVANLCEDAIKSVVFNISTYESGTFLQTSVANSAPFTVGGDFSKPSPIFNIPGQYFIFGYAFLKPNGGGFPIRMIDMDLTVLPSQQVTSFVLVNTNTQAGISGLFPSYQIDLATYPSNAAFSIRAETIGNVRSVQFNLAGGGIFYNNTNYTFVDNAAPFALGGNSASGVYYPVKTLLAPGSYTLTATPYSGPSRSGSAGLSNTIYIEVLARFRVNDFTLVDTSTNMDNGTYFGEINLLDYPAKTGFTILANTIGASGSVFFALIRDYGNSTEVQVFTNTDNSAPYALGSENKRTGHYLAVPSLTIAGNYILQATAYSGTNKQGLASPPELLYFQVLPRFAITSFTLVDVTTGKDVASLALSSFNEVDLSQHAASATFTIRANTVGNTVGSVLFVFKNNSDFNSTPISKVDNVAPFTLDGSSVSGHFNAYPDILVPAYYEVDATPYASANKQGDAGPTQLAYFQVLPRFYIESFTLVNAVTGSDISSQSFEIEIDLSQYSGSAQFSFRANVAGKVGSIEFQLYRYVVVGVSTVLKLTYVSNSAPFALGGLTSAGHYQAVPNLRLPGSYRLFATPYAGPNKQGVAGPVFEMDFPVLPQFRVTNFTLIDATTNKVTSFFGTYYSVIILANYTRGTSFNLKANTFGSVGSVALSLTRLNGGNGTYTVVASRLANTAPFALGAVSSGNYEGVATLSLPGIYQLSATPYSGKNKRGTQGNTVTLDFNVVNQAVADSCAGFCGGFNVFGSCSCDQYCPDNYVCCIDWCNQCPEVSPKVCNS